MQKQREPGRPFPVALPEAFPVSAFLYTQRYRAFEDRHWHGCAEIGLCLAGSGVFFLGNKAYPFRKGTVSFVPPQIPHIAQSADLHPSRWWFCSFDPAFFAPGLAFPEGRVSPDGETAALFGMLREELERLESGAGDREGAALLLRYLLRRVSRAREEAALEGNGFQAVLPAIHALSAPGGEAMTTAELASLCHFSVSRFREVFRRAAGCTPMAYRTRLRLLDAAGRLRETDDPVARIAADTSFGSLSAFNRQFKASFGISPVAYRRAAAGRDPGSSGNA